MSVGIALPIITDTGFLIIQFVPSRPRMKPNSAGLKWAKSGWISDGSFCTEGLLYFPFGARLVGSIMAVTDDFFGLAVILVWLLCAFTGGMMGDLKGVPGLGFLLGLLFGPFGILFAFLLKK
jgi:hypothetical protein